MKVEYDIEKERRNLQRKADKILNKYPNINGLDEILNKNLNLYDSEPFTSLTKNIKSYIRIFNEMNIYEGWDLESIMKGNYESVDKEFDIIKYCIILEDPKLYFPNLWGDTIIFNYFMNSVIVNFGILTMKSGDKSSYSKALGLTNKVMVLLNDFEKDISFDSADESFFKSLKATKWNKKAKKLFDKILSIQDETVLFVIAILFSDISNLATSVYYSILTFLTACSAVNNGRDRMEYEDVICAYKTFYKLLDADINDLI